MFMAFMVKDIGKSTSFGLDRLEGPTRPVDRLIIALR
jgi:hypothetical protein